MKRLKCILPGVIFLLFSILILVEKSNIKIVSRSKVSSAVFPGMIGWAMAALSVCLILCELKSMSEKELTEESTLPQEEISIKKGEMLVVIGTFFLIILYISLLNKIGFICSTFMYLFGQTMVLAKPKQRKYWYLLLLMSLFIAAVIYYVFYYGFSLMLPAGIWG